MRHKGRFTRVGTSKKRMYGPRGLLVCGYPEEERRDFLGLVDQVGPAGIRVVFALTGDLGTDVGEIFSHEHMAGYKGASGMPRAVVMSGLAHNELHRLMTVYREAGFGPQLWASLTPVSEKWPLEQLLRELQAENKAMKDRRVKNGR